ncbi:unnamed protein product [Peronospora destructor]|uniref:Uncharacterized protein n=1 Tax=Peronospora destructor TaxID=86335 RepID=A0AAV0T8B5_9STRA|nr:unnamed protein product [Peronospora destructor]
MIAKVYDQYTNFVSLELNLFSLKFSGSYRAYNDPIQIPSGEHLNVRNGVFVDNTSSFQRPVLIIMDRNEDIATALHHPSTYQALVDDVLSIQMNRVKVSVKYPVAGTTVVMMTDWWNAHAIDANEKEMKPVTGKEEMIRAQTGGGDALLNGTKDLVAAVDTLPALVEKKKMLEVHTNIFHAAFQGVTKRHIPSYSMLEQNLIDGSHVDKTEVLQLLASTEMGTMADKMRLLMIYFLSTMCCNIRAAGGLYAGVEVSPQALGFSTTCQCWSEPAV